MIIILSPAKTMDTETPVPVTESTSPLFLERASELVTCIKTYSMPELKQLLDVSDKLAQLNYDRVQAWSVQQQPVGARPAIYTFKGDAYVGLDAFSLTPDDIAYSQSRLRVLSGLYGMLRPLDLMQPYRLEMGGKFVPPGSKSMLDYWKRSITDAISEQLSVENNPLLVNLASTEYSSAIDLKRLEFPVVTPQFLENKKGTYKVVSAFAKKARGMMARWLLVNRIEDAGRLSEFAEAGYTHCPDRSTDGEPVFIR